MTYAARTLLVGDEMADVMMEWSAALAADGAAEALTVVAIGRDGDDVVATFQLGAGSPVMVGTSATTLPEPDNAGVVARLRALLDRRATPRPIVSEPPRADADEMPE
ncbi:hypothetical protein BFL37_14280 [Clavibacter michiganensis]|uniref:Uncharacterized protein n=1 Tax=Clavibacter michiganensis TaxID=28447 RepID=A0A251YG35_9MICO|nr:hypothetical protein BFL37_14280 [Clavibacter michiganensis]